MTVEVTNTGDVAGDEVVQMYIRDKKSSVTRPVKELKGFKRIMLEPVEFEIMVGTSSVDYQTVNLIVI